MRILLCSFMAARGQEHGGCCLAATCVQRTPAPGTASYAPALHLPPCRNDFFHYLHGRTEKSVRCCGRLHPTAEQSPCSTQGCSDLWLGAAPLRGEFRPLEAEGCALSPLCSAEVLWVGLKAPVAFLFPSTRFGLALGAVCKILEGLLLLFSLSGMSGSTSCIYVLPGKMDCGFKVFLLWTVSV